LHRRDKTFNAERDWFFSEDSERLFSFQSVCDALNLSAERIRRQLLVWEMYSLSGYKLNQGAAPMRTADRSSK